jgi:hypothetical protein
MDICDRSFSSSRLSLYIVNQNRHTVSHTVERRPIPKQVVRKSNEEQTTTPHECRIEPSEKQCHAACLWGQVEKCPKCFLANLEPFGITMESFLCDLLVDSSPRRSASASRPSTRSSSSAFFKRPSTRITQLAHSENERFIVILLLRRLQLTRGSTPAKRRRVPRPFTGRYESSASSSPEQSGGAPPPL